MRTWTVWGGLLLVVGLPGCGKLAEKLAEKAAKEAQQQAATPDPATAEVDKDGQLADKLSHYISCLNGASRNVFTSRNSYTEYMKDEKVGYTGKEVHTYGPQEIHQADSCIKDLDEAKKKQPPLADIEAAAQVYRTTLEKVTAEAKTANTYYYTYYSGGQWVLAKSVAGTVTGIGWYVATHSPGTYTVRLDMTGTDIDVDIDGVNRISVTDSSITAAGVGGIRSSSISDYNTGKHLDNFTVADATVAATPRSQVIGLVGL